MSVDKSKLLGRKIKALQNLYGFTNYQMGEKLRVSERSYSRYVGDPKKMKVGDILRLEQVLHTELINIGEGTIK